MSGSVTPESSSLSHLSSSPASPISQRPGNTQSPTRFKMQFLTSAISLSLAATSLAAPLLEQRASEIQTITFFTGKQYGGTSATIAFNTTKGDYCRMCQDTPSTPVYITDTQAEELPASVNNHAWSFKLSEQRGGISCRLHEYGNIPLPPRPYCLTFA